MMNEKQRSKAYKKLYDALEAVGEVEDPILARRLAEGFSAAGSLIGSHLDDNERLMSMVRGYQDLFTERRAKRV